MIELPWHLEPGPLLVSLKAPLLAVLMDASCNSMARRYRLPFICPGEAH